MRTMDHCFEQGIFMALVCVAMKMKQQDNDLCDSDYVGYTARHLHERIVEQKFCDRLTL